MDYKREREMMTKAYAVSYSMMEYIYDGMN